MKFLQFNLERGMEAQDLQCWKDLISEVKKDPWGLAFKIITKRLISRRKTPGLENPQRVKYIVRSLFTHVEPFQGQDRSSCVVRREELFTSEELKRAGGRQIQRQGSTECQRRSSKRLSGSTHRSSWKPSNPVSIKGGSL